MTTSLPAPNTSHPAQSTLITIATPGQEGIRPALPDTRVTEATIEDAYVNFIFFCNPAVPLTTDSAPLREAFRALPKSDGRTFRPFTLFELVKQLHNKELKTWGDLAVKLGVRPPDLEKGESSQRIQQYAARLKRWMHSLHVNAFFDYLLGREHPYWTEVPTDPDPVCEGGRDGVPAEDDMALRALLPRIRPRRGRRKPEDDLNKSPSQRPRLASPSFPAEMPASRPDGLELWTAHPDGRGPILFPSAEQARSSILPGPNSGFPWGPEASRTPLTAHPQSAMTPVNGSFWGDPAEPRSAVAKRRHGPKVVSSAWGPAGTGAGGKRRGRPPNQRNHELATPTVAEASPVLEKPEAAAENSVLQPEAAAENSVLQPEAAAENIVLQSEAAAENSTLQPGQVTTTPVIMLETNSPVGPGQPAPPGPRPNRPGRLSLQVPQRASGSVRLATPPPAFAGAEENPTGIHAEMAPLLGHAGSDWKSDVLPRSHGGAQSTQTAPGGGRASMLAAERTIVSDLMTADWADAGGNKTAACSLDEATALAQKMTEDMVSQSPTPDALLRKLATLIGGSLLRGDSQVTVKRVVEGPTRSKYECRWPLVYGTLVGEVLLVATVAHDQWKKSSGGDGREAEARGSAEDGEAARWKEKYEELLRATTAGARQARNWR